MQMKIKIDGKMNPCTFIGCSFEERACFQNINLKVDADKKTRTKDFGKAVWILFIDQDKQGKTINHELLHNPNLDLTKGRGIRLMALLISKNIDVLIKSNVKIENLLASILLEVGIELRDDKLIDTYLKTIIL